MDRLLNFVFIEEKKPDGCREERIKKSEGTVRLGHQKSIHKIKYLKKKLGEY